MREKGAREESGVLKTCRFRRTSWKALEQLDVRGPERERHGDEEAGGTLV